MRFSITRSTDGTPLISCGPEDLVLREFLEAELINDLAYLRHLKEKITHSKPDPFEITGNMYSLTSRDGVFEIINLFEDEEQQTGRTDRLLEILETVIEVLDGKNNP